MKQSTIIPIASGKGGVGKSFLCAILAVALASFMANITHGEKTQTVA